MAKRQCPDSCESSLTIMDTCVEDRRRFYFVRPSDKLDVIVVGIRRRLARTQIGSLHSRGGNALWIASIDAFVASPFR
jgi:hypothetical protein